MSKDKKKEQNKDTSVDQHEEEALAESQADRVTEMLDRNRNFILMAIVGAAIAILAVLIFKQVAKQKHLAAGSAYSKAAESRDIAALDGVIVEHPGSVGAGNAMLTKADVQIDQGKALDAQKTLEIFISEFKNHPRMAQGLFALANLHHVAGDQEKAKSYYEQTIAEQEDGELTPLARIRLGDLALEAGDKAGADQHYQDSYIKHPGNPFFAMAEERIALLKVGKPPVVDRPKPPPEPKKEEEKS